MATLLDRAALDQLRSSFRGEALTSEDLGYEEARRVYNGMIDRRPALVARCRTVADVIAGVDFARDLGLDLAVRGGGHNGAGLGVVDAGRRAGPVADERGARRPRAATATVEGGALLGDLDHAAGRSAWPRRPASSRRRGSEA